MFTVAESSELERSLPGGHTKNLFLKDDKGRLVLVIAESSTRVDLKSLSKKLGAGRFSFGKPELSDGGSGCHAGSVNAFAVMNHRRRSHPGGFRPQPDGARDRQLPPQSQHGDDKHSREDLLRFIREGGHEPSFGAGSAGTRRAARLRYRRKPSTTGTDDDLSRPAPGGTSQRASLNSPLLQAGLKHEENSMDFGARKPAAGAAPVGDVMKDTTTAGFAKDVSGGLARGARSRRFLGALVRTVQAVDADHRKGCPQLQRQSSSGEGEH